MVEPNKGVGVVETKYFTFGKPPNQLPLESGEVLGPITLAYETYGTLNDERSNAVLVLHALSGDSHAAGYHTGDRHPGWWDAMIGPGKALDTEKCFVICSNVIGGCKGSTGPSTVNPKTKRFYGLDFPLITVKDMVYAQLQLINHLEVERLLTVIGGSMGGMQVLQWMVSYPCRIRSAIPIATALKHSPQQIAFNEVGRQAILADPNWDNGEYYWHDPPNKGLAVARMVGHITYMSDTSMTEKFGRRVKANHQSFKFSPNFEVEGYLQNRGNHFVQRFDANSYLYITKAIDAFNLLNGTSVQDVFKQLQAKVLVIAFKSDWLYPPYQSEEIVRACKLSHVDATYCLANSTYGHDAFLLEVEEETHLIKHFLRTVTNDRQA